MNAQHTVLIRIMLYMVAGRLAAGGWLPPDAHAMFTSPEMVELVAAAVVGFGSLAWYWFSQSHKALRQSLGYTK